MAKKKGKSTPGGAVPKGFRRRKSIREANAHLMVARTAASFGPLPVPRRNARSQTCLHPRIYQTRLRCCRRRASTRQNAWGIVYEISNLDVESLDRSEGYRSGREGNSYWRRECLVLLEGDEHRPQRVFTYFGDPQLKPPGPNAKYKELIVSGARYWHLPDDYIRGLEAIVAIE
jgi:hypothetical protein